MNLSKVYFSVNLIFSGTRGTLIAPGFALANEQAYRKEKSKNERNFGEERKRFPLLYFYFTLIFY